MVSVPEEPSEAVIGRSRDVRAALARKQQFASLPSGATGQVVSLAGDTIRSKALEFLVDHAEIASEGASLKADGGSTKEVSESPEHDRAEERA